MKIKLLYFVIIIGTIMLLYGLFLSVKLFDNNLDQTKAKVEKTTLMLKEQKTIDSINWNTIYGETKKHFKRDSLQHALILKELKNKK